MDKKQAKQRSQEIVEKINEQQNEQKSVFEQLAKEIEQINPELGGFEELSLMLALPEDSFAFIAPVFLDELQKSYNNVDDKIRLAQTLNASGVKIEDLQDSYLTLIQEIDTQLDGKMSVQKRDFLKNLMGITYNTIADTQGVSKKIIQIPIEFCNEEAKMPAYANIGDAGLDIYALEDITIHPGETVLLKTGLKVSVPYGYELQVRPKSGRSLRSKLRIANTPGTIDSGYRDEIGIIVENIESPIQDITYTFDTNGKPIITSIEHGKNYTIGKGEKIAQLVLNEIPKVNFYKVETINTDGNRGGGFGSSGLK